MSLWQDLREPGQPEVVEDATEPEPIEAIPGPESYPVLTPAGIEPPHPRETWATRRN